MFQPTATLLAVVFAVILMLGGQYRLPSPPTIYSAMDIAVAVEVVLLVCCGLLLATHHVRREVGLGLVVLTLCVDVVVLGITIRERNLGLTGI